MAIRKRTVLVLIALAFLAVLGYTFQPSFSFGDLVELSKNAFGTAMWYVKITEKEHKMASSMIFGLCVVNFPFAAFVCHRLVSSIPSQEKRNELFTHVLVLIAVSVIYDVGYTVFYDAIDASVSMTFFLIGCIGVDIFSISRISTYVKEATQEPTAPPRRRRRN